MAFNPGHPSAFSSVSYQHDYHDKKIHPTTLTRINELHPSYSLHKEFKQTQKNPTYSHFKRYQFQCDLVDIQNLAKDNDNVNYLFTCIDTFTKFAFVRMLERKDGNSVLRGFKSILQEAVQPPLVLVMDRGAEFHNKIFSDYCLQNGITFYAPDTSMHGGIVERFNRTLQSIIYRYMTEYNTRRFIDRIGENGTVIPLMPLFLQTYNNRNHRMIGTTPAIAESNPHLHVEIRKRLSSYYAKIKSKPVVFQVGDFVRISRFRDKFFRGYKGTATDEIFKVHAINRKHKIPLYILSNLDGSEIIRGSFYASEIVKVSPTLIR